MSIITIMTKETVTIRTLNIAGLPVTTTISQETVSARFYGHTDTVSHQLERLLRQETDPSCHVTITVYIDKKEWFSIEL